ncbi:bacteriorhodopsin [uncultured Pseudokineococcus sp.]|uniref:bacteriorhodopsin n=1 Tax=uncultured Pseudokineococcus sp. TaxID=1642928 RepID=UPI0026037CD5|nr:bacteriorhodopsin [uncultured Pseudokineococcus sp.]
MWLWSYVGVMALGAVVFGVWARNPLGVPRVEYVVAAAIPVWSGTWYAVMALGGGQTEVAGQTTYWARYVDWVVTTPLLLVALALTATHALPRFPRRLVAALVAADVVMITAGALADLAEAAAWRYALHGLGWLGLVAVLALVWGPLRRLAEQQPPAMAAAFRRVALLLSLLWLGYPLVWLLGPSGLGLVGQTTDTALFVLLPAVSKVVWSVVDLTELRTLSRRGELRVA